MPNEMADVIVHLWIFHSKQLISCFHSPYMVCTFIPISNVPQEGIRDATEDVHVVTPSAAVNH